MRRRRVAIATPGGAIARAAQALRENASELLLTIGTILLMIGFSQWWRPGVYLIPGAVFVWIGLPSRVPFVIDQSPPRASEEK